jgi:hypothetical protein
MCVVAMATAGGCGSSPIVMVTRPTKAIVDRLQPCGEVKRREHMCPASFDVRRLLGEHLADAEVEARRHELKLRVVRRDGKGLNIQRDAESNRIDIGVEQGIVTSIEGFG